MYYGIYKGRGQIIFLEIAEFVNTYVIMQVISLPECFNSPYGTKYFPEYAESLTDGETSKALKAAAEKNKVGKTNFAIT